MRRIVAGPPAAACAASSSAKEPTLDELLELSEVAISDANVRVNEAEKARQQSLEALKADLGHLDVASSPLGGITTKLHDYNQQMELYDQQVREAELALEQATLDRSHLVKAEKLRHRSEQYSSMVHRSQDFVSIAKSKCDRTRAIARQASADLDEVMAKLRSSPSKTLHPTPRTLTTLRAGIPAANPSTADLALRLPLNGGAESAGAEFRWEQLLSLNQSVAKLPLEERLQTAILETTGASGQVYNGSSCGLKIHQQPRRSAILLVEHRFFDAFILLTILANCATMAWESPLDPSGTAKAQFIDVCEWIFLAIFTVELLLKVLAYGLLFHSGAYLHSPWCILDCTVVTIGWLPILLPEVYNLSALRAFRALRPLRALKRVPGMPMLVQWVLDVLPKMANVLMLCGFILLVFGIVGMETFKGALHNRCARSSLNVSGSAREQTVYDLGITCRVDDPDACAAFEGATCAQFGTNPHHGTMSFDSIALASIALVQGFTLDDWASPMYALENAVSPFVIVYFVLIVLLGGFFVVNLFLAVIFLEFGASKRRIEVGFDTQYASAFGGTQAPAQAPAQAATAEQAPLLPIGTDLSDAFGGRKRRMTSLDMGQAADAPGLAAVVSAGELPDGPNSSSCWDCYPEEGSWRDRLADVMCSGWISALTTSLVLLNMVLMCMPYVGMSAAYESLLEQCATLITCIFIIEMCLKLLANGCATYWEDGWNCLDGSIVLLSIAEIVLSVLAAGTGVKLSFLRMLRMLRVLRVLRLMRTWRGLYEVVSILLRALPQMGNIVCLVLIFIFMFALIGMQLFGGMYTPATGFSLEPCPAGVCADATLSEKPHYHFDYCGPAMLTTFILITGEWVQAMQPAAGLYGPWVSLFFIPTVLVGKYLLLNLLVAVILVEFQEQEESPKTTRRTQTEREREQLARVAAEDAPAPTWPRDYACLLFEPAHPLRRACGRLAASARFDRFVIVAIVLSSICLAIDTPRVETGSTLELVLGHLDVCFTVFFTVEMLIKVLAFGFACGDGAYIHSVWNQVDFAIVCISLLVLLADEIEQLRGLRVMRVMRVLRPLRLVSHNEGMKLIIGSLFKAMPGVSNVFGVVLALQVVFAILGLQLFMGEMGSCTDPAITTQADCVGVSADGDSRQWTNPAVGSFDNFGEAMRLLYVMSSGDDWPEPMFTMMGVTMPGHAPVRNDMSLYALYSIAWICVGFIFAINLFVGVVVDNFSRIQREEDGSATMTVEQQQWVATVKFLLQRRPTRARRAPQSTSEIISAARRILFGVVTSKLFDGLITAVIVINVGVMACDYYGIEDDPENLATYESAMFAFNIVYYVECLSKISGLGAQVYFDDPWCRFDFSLVIASLIDDLAEDVLARFLPLPPMLLRTLRVVRIVRVLRLLKSAKGLRDLLVTMILSLPSLLNVSSLLALIIYIYAVLGVQLFTFLAHGNAYDGINPTRNFESMGSAALLLFQCLTGDGWSDLMVDSMLSEDSGECSEAAGTCGSVVAVPYFISFQVLGSFIFLNLVVAVILENFATLHNINPRLVNPSDLEAFLEAWAEFDPDATTYIPSEDLPKLLLRVPRPLGVKGTSERYAEHRCVHINVRRYRGGLVEFNELVAELLESNYFHNSSISGGLVDEIEFKERADPHGMGRIPLPERRIVQLDRNPLVRDAETVAQAYAAREVATAAANWKRRREKRLRLKAKQKAADGTAHPDWRGVDNRLLGLALGAVEKGVLMELPPSMDVDGDKFVKLGWLRWNGEKRWIKLGSDALEMWLGHQENGPAKRYPWGMWGVTGIDIDLNRTEPAMAVTIMSKVHTEEEPVVLVLQAYEKESEPTEESRKTHLRGFLDELKLHLAPDIMTPGSPPLRKADLTRTILALQAKLRGEAPSHRRGVSRLLNSAAKATSGLRAAALSISPLRHTPSDDNRSPSRSSAGSPTPSPSPSPSQKPKLRRKRTQQLQNFSKKRPFGVLDAASDGMPLNIQDPRALALVAAASPTRLKSESRISAHALGFDSDVQAEAVEEGLAAGVLEAPTQISDAFTPQLQLRPSKAVQLPPPTSSFSSNPEVRQPQLEYV